MLYAEGMQVYYDMLVWDAKKFGHKIFLKDNEADRFIKTWREWFSQHYDGCREEEEIKVGSLDFWFVLDDILSFMTMKEMKCWKNVDERVIIACLWVYFSKNLFLGS